MGQLYKTISVLQIVFAWGSGGVERLIANYVQNMSKIHMDVLVIQTQHKDSIFSEEIIKYGGNVYQLKSKKCSAIGRLLGRIKDIQAFCNTHKYDIIHVNGGTGIDISYALAAKSGNPKAKVVMHSHADNVEPPKIMIKKMAHYIFRVFLKNVPDAYLACSASSLKWMFGELSNSYKKYEVLLNGIDIDQYKFDETTRKNLRQKLGIDRKLVLGTVGRLEPQKNPVFILDLIEKILKVRQDISFIWIGEGSLLDWTKQEAETREISRYIEFVGATDEVNKYYQAMDVFVLPSVYEGLGIVNIEAQCTGLKCMVSNVVPREARISDLVKFLPIDDAQRWADIIVNIQNSYKRVDQRKQAKEYGYGQFETARKLYSFYIELLNEK